MQSSPRNNLLRNSYGYQIVDPPPLRSPTAKAFLMPAHQNTASQSSSTASSIRQLENKLEGLAAKKLTQAETNRQDQQPLQAGLEGQARMRGLPFAQNEPLSEGLLRGSCQNVMQKFDYNVLRNTTHFNPLSKPPPTHNELRRSPGA